MALMEMAVSIVWKQRQNTAEGYTLDLTRVFLAHFYEM